MAATPRYSKPPSCAGCSLEHAGWGFAPPSGPVGAAITVVGEALGAEEAIAGEPFYGSAGGMLSRIFLRAGIDRSHVRIANVVSCRPPNDYLAGAPYELHAVARCKQYLEPILAQVPSNGVVIPLGGVALDAILNLSGTPGVAVKDFHGTVQRDPLDRFWVVPTFHPAHLLRGKMNLLEVVADDVRRAQRLTREGFLREDASLIVDPPVEWFARWCQDAAARMARDPDNLPLSIDTEFVGKPMDEDSVGAVEGKLLTRFNVTVDRKIGITVPWTGDYLKWIYWLLAQWSAQQGIVWLWNKYADWTLLAQAGCEISGIEAYDLMWLWHHLQSDCYNSLGFVAPMASSFGAWKHWSKRPDLEGQYAAADALQNHRVGEWLFHAAHQAGMLDLFVRDWHERDRYCLRPSHELGVPVDKPALEAYHQELQRKLGVILDRLKQTEAAGVLKPKLGYAKRPKGPACTSCHGDGTILDDHGDHGMAVIPCGLCSGTGQLAPVPPASIMGKPKQGGGEAKTAYMHEGVKLVEKQMEVEILACATCGAEDVGPKHRCPKPKVRKARARPAGERDRVAAGGAPAGEPVVGAGGDPASAGGPPSPVLRPARVLRPRWFWQLPFNPDARNQILAYLEHRGIDAPLDKKKKTATTNKQALKDLARDYEDDPFFQLQLDWRAVQKVDSTYAVGSLARLDKDSRLHPEYLPKPSTLRDSCVSPNLTNVVADKAGPEGLAAGFRKCIIARDGLPPGVDDATYAAWEAKWPS